MTPIRYAICALALGFLAPAWAVNKCTGPDGKVMFQDAPCPGTGITVAEDLARKKEEREKDVAGATKKKAENPTSVDVEQMVKAAMQKNEEALQLLAHAAKTAYPNTLRLACQRTNSAIALNLVSSRPTVT